MSAVLISDLHLHESDSSLYEKVNQICMKKFEGKTIKAENPMMAMMSQMMGGMGGGAR